MGKSGMGGWDSKIASCIPVPLKINPFDDSIQLENKIVELLTSAVKENVKNDQSKVAKLLDQVNDLANEVKKQIAEELNKTTSRLQKNLNEVFPEHNVDIAPQADKIEVDKILATGTHLNVAGNDGKYYPLANQGSGLQRAFLWSAIEALADTGKMKSGRSTIESEKPKMLLVEEPESFLHPPAVRLAREALYKIAELDNWQVMLLHTPLFLLILQNHIQQLFALKKMRGQQKFSRQESTVFR